tara:strand:+ start:500 stop:697 length:198 start_codon:yes stop_codon:yes gene_type:complete
LERESEYEIEAYKEGSKERSILGWVRASSGEQAIEAWKRENPSKARTLSESGKFKFIALVYGGGI